MNCTENDHVVYETLYELALPEVLAGQQCVCSCDEGYILDVDGNCVKDTSCDATLLECPDFDLCVNKGGLTYDDTTGEVTCTDPNAYPANDGNPNSGIVTCVCDGKNNCEWQSDDFKGDIEEECMCLTDSKCPVT